MYKSQLINTARVTSIIILKCNIELVPNDCIAMLSFIIIYTLAGVSSSTPEILAGFEPLIENPYVFSSISRVTVLGLDQVFSAEK